jgi:DNA modification methylase
VLDPFGGLSTTADVAAALGRVGITIELNPEYCEEALRRIRRQNGPTARSAGDDPFHPHP